MIPLPLIILSLGLPAVKILQPTPGAPSVIGDLTYDPYTAQAIEDLHWFYPRNIHGEPHKIPHTFHDGLPLDPFIVVIYRLVKGLRSRSGFKEQSLGLNIRPQNGDITDVRRDNFLPDRDEPDLYRIEWRDKPIPLPAFSRRALVDDPVDEPDPIPTPPIDPTKFRQDPANEGILQLYVKAALRWYWKVGPKKASKSLDVEKYSIEFARTYRDQLYSRAKKECPGGNPSMETFREIRDELNLDLGIRRY